MKSKKGLDARILGILGLIALLTIGWFIGRQYLPDNREYQRSQTRLLSLKTKLPAEPLAEIKYPIKGYRIPGVGGFCWLESAAGLIKYLEPEIDFDTFVYYGRPTLIMARRDQNERWGMGLNQIHAFSELGYTTYRGSTSALRLPQSVFPDIKLENFLYFKSEVEELAFMKRLISAQIIPTVVYEGDFSTVVGYNQEGLWLVKSDPSQTDKEGRSFLTPPVVFEPTFITYSKFFEKWGFDHQFFWFEKTDNHKPLALIDKENKINAQEAGQNLAKVIAFLKNGGNLLDFTYALDIPSAISLSRYLDQRGQAALARQYLEIAKAYEAQRAPVGPGVNQDNRQFYLATLEKVKPLIETAGQMWP